MNSTDKRTGRRLMWSVLAIVALSLGLCVTTYALVRTSVQTPDNTFQTGAVSIDLNGGKAIINEHEFLFEPGMTVEKPFFIRNLSTWDVYYRVYFSNVTGGLADVLEITIREGDSVLFTGTATELTRANAAAGEILRVNERRELIASFHIPEGAGNAAQNLTLAFDLCADAVQTKNNPDRLFA